MKGELIMRFLSTQGWMSSILILVVFGTSSCTLRSSYIDTMAEDGTRIIRIEAERFDFRPSQIRVRQGERVRLIFRSRDTTHGVAIAAYQIRKDIPPRGKGETIVEFTADKAGSFTYRCSHLCGAGHAMMRGTLVVEP
ncbi:cupredoxin domain-containing protein [candidate division TA06 bacterium]|nr:cupredoxin domain-containing protein [candidate division TA06 bacterium]